jgi:hypothetical protein
MMYALKLAVLLTVTVGASAAMSWGISPPPEDPGVPMVIESVPDLDGGMCGCLDYQTQEGDI